MKSQKYHTAGTFPTFFRKIAEIDKIDTHNTQMHDCLLSWLGTDTSIKSRGIKLVLCDQTSSLSENL